MTYIDALVKALMTHFGSIEKDHFKSLSNWPIIFNSQHIYCRGEDLSNDTLVSL